MTSGYLRIEQSGALTGTVTVLGAKNAVLVTMASLLLTEGVSRLTNVPASADVLHMIALLKSLGAQVTFDRATHILIVDTSFVDRWSVDSEIMKKMRASILVMGPLLARFSRADIAFPGGCVIGERPIDYHLINFAKMGVIIESEGSYLKAHVDKIKPVTLVLEYPSVGATENSMMAAVAAQGITTIINAALEPEVLDLIDVLRKMGARISVEAPATIVIEGGYALKPVDHAIVVDRLEVGTILAAAAITGGTVTVSNGRADHLAVFLLKLREMGHIVTEHAEVGITLRATKTPKAVSFKTSPYPGFPTDLQAPMMALQCTAQGKSVVYETVFENRFLHVRELQKMGAQIVVEGSKAVITGVDGLYGTHVIASDIRASCALVLAGLAAKGTTIMTGIHHWQRGYDNLDRTFQQLGAPIELHHETFIQPIEQEYQTVKSKE